MLAEKQKVLDDLREIEATMNESRRQLEEQLRASMASTEERWRKEVAEKDVTIAELTQAVMDQGCDLLTTGKE